MTPHNEAKKGDFAEAVLLPGDPDRAAWIAETFFDQPRRVNAIRSCFGYTGTYRGMPVSVQATGMGRASFDIMVHELMTFYGVRTAIRVGTCGGLQLDVRIRDVVVVDSARMDFEVTAGHPARPSNPVLLGSARSRAKDDGIAHHVGPIVSSDVYYHPDPVGRFALARRQGAIACDMESAGLYALGEKFGARTLSICTVVDNLITNEETALSERQALFTNMCRLALNVLADTRQN